MQVELTASPLGPKASALLPCKLMAGSWGGVRIPEFCSHIYCNLSLWPVKMRTVKGCSVKLNWETLAKCFEGENVLLVPSLPSNPLLTCLF